MSENPAPVDDATTVLPMVGHRPPVSPHHRTEPEPAPDGPPPLVTIVLPCFNEREHVIEEVERICTAMDDSGLTYELLASKDGKLSFVDSLPVRGRAEQIRVWGFAQS